MNEHGSYTTTKGISVLVEPRYVPEQSSPDFSRYMFSYTITITNERRKRVQLLSRQWMIISGDGKKDIVEGPGVIGQTPVLYKGESFTYTSFCPIDTHWGTMEGTFTMLDNQGKLLDIAIDRFYLVCPFPVQSLVS